MKILDDQVVCSYTPGAYLLLLARCESQLLRTIQSPWEALSVSSLTAVGTSLRASPSARSTTPPENTRPSLAPLLCSTLCRSLRLRGRFLHKTNIVPSLCFLPSTFLLRVQVSSLPLALQAEGVHAKQEDLSVSQDGGEAGVLRGEEDRGEAVGPNTRTQKPAAPVLGVQDGQVLLNHLLGLLEE